MRVVTWNVQWREREDWRARAPAIRDTLAALDPDVVCLQEVWATAGTSLAALLGPNSGVTSRSGRRRCHRHPTRRSGPTWPASRSAWPC